MKTKLFMKDVQILSVNDKRSLSIVIANEMPNIVILACGDFGISVSKTELIRALMTNSNS